MEKIKRILLSERNILIILFAAFLFLRLFVSQNAIFVSSDHLRFLDLAAHFPHHTLDNNQLFLIHPPLYPYLIHFFTLAVGQDYLAAILISLLSACILFFVVYKFFMLLTDNFLVTLTVLILFTLSVDFVIASNTVMRESFLVMMLMSTAYFYVKGVKFNDKKAFIFASILGALSALSTDHAIFLLPTFVATYIFFKGRKTNLRYAALPFVATALFFGFWVFVKVYQYSTNEYYPSGLEGAPVSTKDFGVFQVMNTHYFKDYDPNLLKGLTRPRDYAYRLGYMFNNALFPIPRGIDFTSVKYLLLPKHVLYMIFIYLPIALIALYGFLLIIKDFIRNKKIHSNVNLYFALLFLIFISLVTQRSSSPRYIFTSYIFFFYFIGYGLFILFKKRRKLDVYSKLVPAVAIILLLLIPFLYYNNPYSIFTVKKVFALNKTTEFIKNNLSRNSAIMVQSGYGDTLNYFVDNRVLGLPPRSEKLFELIDYYDVDYILYGRFYAFERYRYAADAIKFIREHPEKFKLVATITEDYGDSRRSSIDEIYIYKVIR